MITQNYSGRWRQSGFSLIEFIITAALALILALALSQVFIVARSGFGVSQAQGRMQEGARIGLEAIQRDIRMAGYNGCSNDGVRIRNQEYFVRLPGAANPRSFTGVAFQNDFSRSIQGFESAGTAPGASVNLETAASNWLPALSAPLTGRVAPGSDVLVLRYMGPSRARITSYTPDIGGPMVQIDTSVLPGVVAGSVYALANCDQVSFFLAGNVDSGGARFRALGVTGAEYYAPATSYLYEVSRIAYYVGTDINGTRGLFRHEMTEGVALPNEAFIPGVESLQVTYGWDNNLPLPNGAIDVVGTASELAAANIGGIPANSRVGQVRVGLLMMEPTQSQFAEEDVPSDSRTVVGTIISASEFEGDRLLGVYETSAAPRNHIFGY